MSDESESTSDAEIEPPEFIDKEEEAEAAATEEEETATE